MLWHVYYYIISLFCFHIGGMSKNKFQGKIIWLFYAPVMLLCQQCMKCKYSCSKFEAFLESQYEGVCRLQRKIQFKLRPKHETLIKGWKKKKHILNLPIWFCPPLKPLVYEWDISLSICCKQSFKPQTITSKNSYPFRYWLATPLLGMDQITKARSLLCLSFF